MRRLAIAPVLLALGLSACGEDGSEPSRAVDGQGVDEVAVHPGAVCPPTLVDPEDDHGLGTEAPAESRLDLPPADAAWVCEYAPTGAGRASGGNGARFAWSLQGAEHAVPDESLGSVDDLLDELEPAETDRVCTLELGPRFLLLHRVGGDLTGIVVDDYGCRDVRVTDDPFTNPPGEATQPGTVSGVLSGPEGLIDTLRRLAGP